MRRRSAQKELSNYYAKQILGEVFLFHFEDIITQRMRKLEDLEKRVGHSFTGRARTVDNRCQDESIRKSGTGILFFPQ